MALPPEILEVCEERTDLRGPERRGGLVEDEDSRAPVEELEDLNPLLRIDREIPDGPLRIHSHAERLRRLEYVALDLRLDQVEVPRRFGAEHDVLGDREGL